MTHELKTLALYFEELWAGNKTFEIRYNDRNYHTGDKLFLRELRDRRYTGRELEMEVTYWTKYPEGLKPGFIVLAVKELRRRVGTEKWTTRLARIRSILEQHDSWCMDNDEERTKLAKALAEEL